MPIKLDTLVELLDQYSAVYPLSPTGARGWVRARREMPKSDPEAYVEWDKDHWRYHGERDGWSFEHHFRPVDPDAPDMVEAPSMHNILKEAQEKLKLEPPQAPQENFINTLMEAHEETLGSEGYLIITVAPKPTDGGLTVYQPQVYCETLNGTARQAIEAQLIHAAAMLYESLLMSQISGLDPGTE